MEYSIEYIKEHQCDFVVNEASEPDPYKIRSNWNSHHGYWILSDDESIDDKESNIKWVYGIMPYRDNEKIYGVKPIKGFIININNVLGFTSED